jgi:hypothetical protein
MVQIRPGDLIAVRKEDVFVLFAVLTKQILFGGHWSFVFRDPTSTATAVSHEFNRPGFNAFVDFLVPKRESRVTRVSRGNDFSQLRGPELLQQQPLKGEANYGIWRWVNTERESVEYVRFTASPTRAEQGVPEYSCMPADLACELVARGWQQGTSMWVA